MRRLGFIMLLLLCNLISFAQVRTPLKLYWNAARGDNFTLATDQGICDALSAGYTFVKIEGYILREQLPNTVPLKLCWNAARGDNFTFSTDQAQDDAEDANYTAFRTEGYIFKTRVSGTIPLILYWSDERQDNLLSTREYTAQELPGYIRVREEGFIYPAQ